MSIAQQRLFTLDVGKARSEPPDVASIKTSGKIATARELHQDDEVLVTIVDADGEVIASGQGTVNVGFKRHRETATRPGFLERVHTISIES